MASRRAPPRADNLTVRSLDPRSILEGAMMFESHFGLRENPFHSGHQMRFLYPSREHQEARAHLRYGIENREPFVLITGEVGTGKTTALYDALAEWGSKVSVALVTNSALTREEMIEEISLRFGLPLQAGTSKPQALAQLERHLLSVHNRGEHAVLLLDEAQNLAPDLLEEIRLLSNLETRGERLVQIFLVGQPELEAKLTDPQLRQLRQRISVHYRLNPLSPEETAGYIHHRISVAGGNPWAAFPPEACREVYRVTHGIPREINTIATQAMITAYSEGEVSVTTAHVQAAARESEFRSVLGGPADMADDDIPMPAHPSVQAAPPAHAPTENTPIAHIEPETVPVPAWSPPDLEAPPPAPATAAPGGPSRNQPVQRDELDAWSRAAQDLMDAHRRTAGTGAPARPADALVRQAEEPRFPTPAELEARAGQADPGNANLAGLPERLRRKIENDIAREERAHHTAPIVLAAVAVVAIVVGLVLAQRFQLIDVPLLRPIAGMPHEANRAPAPVTAAVSPSVKVAPRLDSTRTATDSTLAAHVSTLAARGDNPVSAAVKPALAAGAPVANAAPARAKPAAPVAGPQAAGTAAAHAMPAKAATARAAAPAAPPAAARPSARPDTLVFGIGVASYLDRDRATQELDRMTALSGLPGQVVPYNSSGTTMFRVVVGQYASHASATSAASDFVAKYGVSEAQPLLLSRRRAR
jgi:type II secretory pathway predicted ATPase ExeA